MKMYLRYSYYLLSIVNFKGIYSFSALLKVRIEKIVLFFLLLKLISEAFVMPWLNENAFEIFLLFVVHG